MREAGGAVGREANGGKAVRAFAVGSNFLFVFSFFYSSFLKCIYYYFYLFIYVFWGV